MDNDNQDSCYEHWGWNSKTALHCFKTFIFPDRSAHSYFLEDILRVEHTKGVILEAKNSLEVLAIMVSVSFEKENIEEARKIFEKIDILYEDCIE